MSSRTSLELLERNSKVAHTRLNQLQARVDALDAALDAERNAHSATRYKLDCLVNTVLAHLLATGHRNADLDATIASLAEATNGQ
jgi:hypothetical protein